MDTVSITKEEEERFLELQLLALDYARSNETQILENMLKAGLNINLQDEKGNTLLMIATYNGSFEVAKLLLEFGAEVDKRNDRGQTPLGGVAFKGNLDIIKLLIRYGADIDADNGGGKTPLMFAAMFGHKDIVDFFIANGADTTKQTFMGFSAYKLATFTGGIRKLFS